MKSQMQGLRPTIITSKISEDKDKLSALGIDTLLKEDKTYSCRFYTAVSDSSIEENL